MRILSFLDFNYMLYWRLHFEKEIPINCLFAQWKWTYILDFGPWNRSALNMGYMDEQPSRMPGWARARVGRPRLWLFRCCPCPLLWHVQRSSGVYNGRPNSMCYLFKRKVGSNTELLALMLQSMHVFGPPAPWRMKIYLHQLLLKSITRSIHSFIPHSSFDRCEQLLMYIENRIG